MTYYSSVLLLSILIPFLFSFHPKIKFYHHFKILAFSIPLTSIPFIFFDIIFTDLGIWGFNKDYTSDIFIFNLPLEEILFFIVIPYCCLYTYHLIEKFNITFFKIADYLNVNILLSLLLLLVAFNYYNNIYTFYCLFSCALLIVFENCFFKKIDYKFFYSTFLVILIPFLIVNGALTGMFGNMVVWYSPEEIIGIRIITIPIEDSIYAYQLIFSNLFVWKYFQFYK